MSKKIVVATCDEGKRIDQFLVGIFSDLSRNKLSKMVTSGKILVNGKKVKPSQKVQVNDIVMVGETKVRKNHKTPLGEKIDLNIMFEDDDVIVINKSAGIVVHPAEGNETGTLVNALINHYPKIIEAIYDEGSEVSQVRPGIVHRLDKETSGVMIVAKNKNALNFLSNEIQSRKVDKYYQAICFDNLPKRSGEIKNKVIRHPKERKQMTISKNEKGKEAITKYKVLNSYKFNGQNISLVEFQILTGRTHQIRVQAKSLNSPVLGDKIYNINTSNSISNDLNINRPLLHSHLLKIRIPSGEIKEFTTEKPADFELILDKLS